LQRTGGAAIMFIIIIRKLIHILISIQVKLIIIIIIINTCEIAYASAASDFAENGRRNDVIW